MTKGQFIQELVFEWTRHKGATKRVCDAKKVCEEMEAIDGFAWDPEPAWWQQPAYPAQPLQAPFVVSSGDSHHSGQHQA